VASPSDQPRRCSGVTFTQATPEERERLVNQVERLARSRFWNEARNTIAGQYQRAYGGGESNPRKGGWGCPSPCRENGMATAERETRCGR
jgi:hypothetical protein